ncbi:peptidoglycan-associated lipoprotein Pal [Geobacter pelophilus]|uniref:Peptidoglycan-associated protein n=1 Tax=Geoanaerobacter pelophilus TaxID=60036 RepID=A0AAW4L8H5_9BACT|nr:peptidoglycan-associated lipoprotein Pal [Geoanaerobacter pelophilus]MBT0666452.1 peptidoglycan-associated lipoprotein Pal [Geoanaerobacter pelophilus]
MNKSVNQLVTILFAGMFLYTGCAKQEVVKKDEPLVSKGTAAKPVDMKSKSPDSGDANTQPRVSEEAKKSEKPEVLTATSEMKTALEKIYFDFDSSTLSETARQTLSRTFDVLKQNPQLKVRVEGHCDERGSDSYNLALGERRARTASHYLNSLGVSDQRLSTVSYGEEKPNDLGHDEASWAKNRRDEFIIIK